jgi:hypothetical protein
MGDTSQFREIPHPVIEGFVLPEMLSLSREDAIGVSGGDAF